MNPFVGLSKVTKKRLDSIENFTKEVESIKEHVSDLESIVEKNLTNIQNYPSPSKQPKIKVNTEHESKDSAENKSEQTEFEPDQEKIEQITDEKTVEETKKTKNDETAPTEKPSMGYPEQNDSIAPEVQPTLSVEPQITPSIQSAIPTNSYVINEEINTSFIDEILTSSFEFFLIEQNIDVLIDEYLHTLK